MEAILQSVFVCQLLEFHSLTQSLKKCSKYQTTSKEVSQSQKLNSSFKSVYSPIAIVWPVSIMTSNITTKLNEYCTSNDVTATAPENTHTVVYLGIKIFV